MEWSSLFGVILVVVVVFLVVKSILNSIRLFFFILLALFFLVLFFNVSLSEVSAWLSSQERLQWLANTLINALMLSFVGS